MIGESNLFQAPLFPHRGAAPNRPGVEKRGGKVRLWSANGQAALSYAQRRRWQGGGGIGGHLDALKLKSEVAAAALKAVTSPFAPAASQDTDVKGNVM